MCDSRDSLSMLNCSSQSCMPRRAQPMISFKVKIFETRFKSSPRETSCLINTAVVSFLTGECVLCVRAFFEQWLRVNFYAPHMQCVLNAYSADSLWLANLNKIRAIRNGSASRDAFLNDCTTTRACSGRSHPICNNNDVAWAVGRTVCAFTNIKV